MDTSDKYVKMCDRSFRILYDEGFTPFPDSFVCRRRDGKIDIYGIFLRDCSLSTARFCDEYFPLFRQDQLQEMYVSKYPDYRERNIVALLVRFTDAILDCEVPYISNPTAEQLWLTFVMHELHNKVWDDGKEDWIIDE